MINTSPVHEAGHALAALLLGLNVTEMLYSNINNASTDVAKEGVAIADLGVVALAGLAAVEIIHGAGAEAMEDQEGAECDLPKARAYATALEESPEAQDCLLHEWRDKATTLLRSPGMPEALEALGGLLVRRGRLTGDDVREVFGGRVPSVK
ncbi:MAG TPA: hypothetical protein VNA57_04340 [Acidimicrobiales bacterium]|nr:hypothetical protein [Acidimicrobiales bacterium]